MLTNPRDAAAMLGGRIVESGQQAQALQEQTFADPNRPFRVTDPQAMARLTDMLMAGPMGFAPAGITAYHGSPYLFRQFDPTKVGTGEGAQAYGVGAGYTAEARKVAEQYQQNVKDMGSIKNVNDRLAELVKIMEADSVYPGAYRKFKSEKGAEAAKEYDALLEKRQGVVSAPGYLYKGDIPDEILPKFLDWDKPVGDQKDVMELLRKNAEARVKERLLPDIQAEIAKDLPAKDISSANFLELFSPENAATNEKVRQLAQERLSKMDIKDLVEKELDATKPRDTNWKLTGKQLYEYLAKVNGSQAKATEILNNAGVRGIQYLDEASRSRGKGTSNFVPFNPEDFKVQEINDIPVEDWISKGLL
jgi:hypothetical protein